MLRVCFRGRNPRRRHCAGAELHLPTPLCVAWNPRDLHVALRNWIASSARSSLQQPRILLDRSPEFRDLRRGVCRAVRNIAKPRVSMDASHTARNNFDNVIGPAMRAGAPVVDRHDEISEMTPTIPSQMAAVQLVGHGGVDKLHYRGDVPTPVARTGEVLIKVAAAGVNNTDINTRIGWYSKTIGDATGIGGANGFGEINDADASWSGVPLSFPRIQGADCCGRIVSAGEGVDRNRIGERRDCPQHVAQPRGLSPIRVLDVRIGMRWRVCAVRKGARSRNAQGRLRLVRRGTGFDSVRVLHGRELAAPGIRWGRNACS